MPKLTLVDVLLILVLLAAPIAAQTLAPGAVAMTASSVAVILAYLKQQSGKSAEADKKEGE